MNYYKLNNDTTKVVTIDKKNKIHVYLISYTHKQALEEIKNIIVIAYTRKEAVDILTTVLSVNEIICIQTLRKNKTNAYWFTQKAYQEQCKIIGYKGK